MIKIAKLHSTSNRKSKEKISCFLLQLQSELQNLQVSEIWKAGEHSSWQYRKLALHDKPAEWKSGSFQRKGRKESRKEMGNLASAPYTNRDTEIGLGALVWQPQLTACATVQTAVFFIFVNCVWCFS